MVSRWSQSGYIIPCYTEATEFMDKLDDKSQDNIYLERIKCLVSFLITYQVMCNWSGVFAVLTCLHY